MSLVPPPVKEIKEAKNLNTSPQMNNEPEQNVKFTSELKNILHEMKFVLFKCNSQLTHAPNGKANSTKENLVDSIDEKSLIEGINIYF